MASRHIYITLQATILLMLFGGNAFAAQRGLILLENLRQSVEFDYQYDGQSTQSDGGSRQSSRQNRLDEIYHFGINYAIYDPRILKGRFGADGKLTQETFTNDTNSGTSHGTDYQYSLDGTFFSQKPLSVSFFSRSGTSLVQQMFSSGYDLTTDSNGAAVTYSNLYLPAQFSYSRVVNETSGLQVDRHQKTENFIFNVSNYFRQLSRTELAMSRFMDDSKIKGDGDDLTSTIDTITLTNDVSWDADGKRRSIYSLYRFIDQSGINEEDSNYLQESIIWDLGRALRWGSDYWFSHRRTPSLNETENQGKTWLEHRLFQSLLTRLAVQARETDRTTGRETFYGGAIDLVYQKKVLQRQQGLLQLEFAQGADVTDRKLTSSQLTAPNETFVASFVTPYRLLHPDVVGGTIVVSSATPGNLHFSVPFIEGIDYSITQVGAFTEIRIIPGGNIVEGVDALVVSYQFLENPDVKYATYRRRIAGSLTLLDGRLRTYASWDQSNQDLLEGEPNVLQLNDLDVYRLGTEVLYDGHAAVVEYLDYDSTLDKHRSIDGTWRYGLAYGIHYLTLRVNERYTRFDPLPSASNRSWENVASVGAVYRRPVTSFALLRIAADYANATGEGVQRDNISTGASLQMRISKFALTLTTLFSWQKTDSITLRNDLVRLELVRFF